MFRLDLKIELPDDIDLLRAILDETTRLEISNLMFQHYFPYIPYGDSGDLSREVNIQPDYIEHLMAYAWHLYNGEGFNFRHDNHPLATAFWDKAMLEAKGQVFFADVQKVIERRLKWLT